MFCLKVEHVSCNNNNKITSKRCLFSYPFARQNRADDSEELQIWNKFDKIIQKVVTCSSKFILHNEQVIKLGINNPMLDGVFLENNRLHLMATLKSSTKTTL